MNRLTLTACLTQLLLVSWASVQVAAWEVTLQSDVTTRAAVVRLGDIGQVTGLSPADTEVLEQIVLAPGPSRSYTRTLSASQIRKILLGRGVELDECRFTGASRSVIVHDATVRTGTATKTNTNDGDTLSKSPWDRVRRAGYRSKGGRNRVEGVEQKVANVVSDQFLKLAGAAVPWQVNVTFPSRALSELPTQWDSINVEGLETAEEGRHQLVACFASDNGDVRVPVEAVATRMVEMVVPVRPLARGEVITARDVELRYIPGHVDQSQVVQRIDDAVGRQVQLSIDSGQPMPAKSLKRPILVKRRDEVEVLSRRAGVSVRMKMRAIDDGALDDTVTLERLDDRKSRVVARVVGVQQAEVCATSASAHRIAER